MARKIRMDLGNRGADRWYENARELFGEPKRRTTWQAEGVFLISANTSGLFFFAYDFASAYRTGEILFEAARPSESKHRFEPLEQGSEEFFLMSSGEAKAVDVSFVEVEVYEPFNPERLKWRDGASARTTLDMKVFHLIGNEPAILSLASHLLSVAERSVPVGAKLAYDTRREPFTESSVPFIVQKQ